MKLPSFKEVDTAEDEAAPLSPMVIAPVKEKSSINTFVKPFVFWVIWMAVGTAFFSWENDCDVVAGFFLAVNVGYCIGWSFPSNSSSRQIVFSMCYMFVGASAVAVALSYFAQSMIESSKTWYLRALREERYLAATSESRGSRITCRQFCTRCWRWVQWHSTLVRALSLWLLWLLLLLGCLLKMYPQWRWVDCLFFAFSSLSTGGLRALPDSSPEWHFGLLACFAATGVPITGYLMGIVADLLISVGDPQQAEKTIKAPVTAEEVRMMQHFGIEDGDGRISKAEYVLLCAVRLGAVEPDLVETIFNRFNALDVDRNGELSFEEITQSVKVKVKAKGTSSPVAAVAKSPTMEAEIDKLKLAVSVSNDRGYDRRGFDAASETSSSATSNSNGYGAMYQRI